MGKVKRLVLLSLVLLLFFILNSVCQENITETEAITEEYHPKPPARLTPPDDSKGEGRGDRSRHEGVFTSTPDSNSRIKITKLLDPNLGTTYLVGDELAVIVEIQNLNKKDIYGLSICERIDNNLEIINGSNTNCYLTKFANKSSAIINSLQKGKEITNINNVTTNFVKDHGIIEIYIDRLATKGRAIYSYKMKPITEGIFSAATIISFKDNEYADYEYYLEDECEKLDTIKIIVTPEKTKIYTAPLGADSSTRINYQITYLHQLPNESGKKLLGKFYEYSEYYSIDYISSNGVTFKDPNPSDNEKPFEIEYGHNCIISLGITYKKENSARTPIMYLDDVPQETDSQIIVIESFFWSHIEFFIAMISLIVAISLEVFLFFREKRVY